MNEPNNTDCGPVAVAVGEFVVLPGVLLPVGVNREPTELERETAERFYEQTVVAIDKYKDVS
ncbi:MAG: hypothetical protein M3094_06625, partial [Actinomycetia bacterium]|nr:hypothetical protein [Actinomycetes bacterium]